jgi:hypothetical protein
MSPDQAAYRCCEGLLLLQASILAGRCHQVFEFSQIAVAVDLCYISCDQGLPGCRCANTHCAICYLRGTFLFQTRIFEPDFQWR